MKWLVIYNRKTFQIEAIISSSTIEPPLTDVSFDPVTETYVRITDPPFEVSRDHKAIIEDGVLIATEASPNPIQPEPPGPNPSMHWARVDSFHAGEQKPLRVKRQWQGRKITVDCYVTQNIADMYQAGNLAAGDVVLVIFVEGDLDKPIAIDKVYGV